MDYYFIVNPTAGKEDCTAQVALKTKHCNLPPDSVHIHCTTKEGDAKEFVANLAASGQKATVFACGGDGTLFEVVNGMGQNSSLILGVMPFGTGNDFVRSYTDKETALNLQAQLEGDVVQIDLMQRDNGEYAVGLSSVGFDADVAYGVSKFKNLPFIKGSGAYILSIVQRLFKKLPLHLEIVLDNTQKISGDFVIAVVANGKAYGGGFIAAPHAQLSDGMLEVITVKKLSRLSFIRLVGKYKKGEHIENGQPIKQCQKFMNVYRCQSCQITSNKPFVCNLDGECTVDSSLQLTLIKQGISLLVPRRQS